MKTSRTIAGMNPFFIIRCFLSLCAIVLLTSNCSHKSYEWAEKSPNGQYSSRIITASSSFGLTNETSVSIYEQDIPVLKKLIRTGDLFDGTFESIYPRLEWKSNSIVKIGSAAKENDSVEIKNSSSHPISFILLETNGSKFLIIMLQPEEVANFDFSFGESISIDGEFADHGGVFRAAMKSAKTYAEGPAQRVIKITVMPDHVNIESNQIDFEATRCCGNDRPSR